MLIRNGLQKELCMNLRRFTRNQSAVAHAFAPVNYSQSSKFTSYFWRNEQWQRNGRRKLLSNAIAAEPEHTSIVGALHNSYPPPLSAVPYRPVPPLTLPRLLGIYAQLSKSRLTMFNVLTAMSAFAVFPLPTTVPVLLATAAGTLFCSASANTLNQLQEVPYDAQMARTRNRPLVRHAISPLHATGFALVTGVAGPALLWSAVNPTTALLGLGNIILYAGPYTYLKRRSVWNTWVGAVVGAVPPLMGWAACGGQILPSAFTQIHFYLPSFLGASTLLPVDSVESPLAPLALFLLLFSWQFPHFMGLSHVVRASYAQAGYQMLAVLNPRKNALVSLRHAVLLIPICSVLVPLSGLTTWWFALTSLVPNALCTKYAWEFWKKGGEKQARKVFHASLWYLPVVMGLMMLHKNGLEWTKWLQGEEKEQELA